MFGYLKPTSLLKRYLIILVGLALLVLVAAQVVLKLAYPSQLWWSFLVLGSAFMAVCAAVAFFMGRADKKSIKRLIGALQAVENGEKCDAVSTGRNDEFLWLEQSINRLIDRDKALREANQDPLTGLANRRYLVQRLERAMETQMPLALMFIDLDGFKPINDDFGHDVGDEALRLVAERLGACIRETDILCRLGGDEFVVMLPHLTDREVLAQRAGKMIEMINTTMWIQGNRVRMGASIGVAVSPQDGTTVEAVMNAADQSMYAAKQGGKNGYRFYS